MFGSHPWGVGSRVGYRPYSMLMVGRRPLADSGDGLAAEPDYFAGDMGRGIFSSPGEHWTGGGQGIFQKTYALPRAIYEEPMYAGANVIDPSADTREHGLYGFKQPGERLQVALAGNGILPTTMFGWLALLGVGYLVVRELGIVKRDYRAHRLMRRGRKEAARRAARHATARQKRRAEEVKRFGKRWKGGW